MYIYINLVSAQLFPNVIPTMSAKSNISKVYLVQSGHSFAHKTQQLKQYYTENGFEDVEVVQTLDAHDYELLRSDARELFDRIRSQHPNCHIVLNATGGTKPMSLAFTKQFDNLAEQSMAIYTDTEKHKVIMLNDASSAQLPYMSILDVPSYLKLSGFQAESWLDRDSIDIDGVYQRAQLSKELLKVANKQGFLISVLNGLCQQTNFSRSNSTFIAQIPVDDHKVKKLAAILDLAQNSGVLTWSGQSITFKSEDVARYLGGGWLEELTFLAAQQAQIEHVAMNVEGYALAKHDAVKNATIANELDVVLVNNNQMLLVEVKTKNWRDGSGQNTVRKLDSLTAELGGMLAKGVLVSALPFNDSTEDRLLNKRNLEPLQVRSYQALVDYFCNWKLETDV
ncbi:DUF1887 family CARF protein [Thalassotalea ponticola]|uniref:Card1-like endonuclease domain-containing protein n=1 Tax=Thalassotalea ponticola TaxID=1523392 RepID=UPI0025B3ADB6|nr:DUF1887 family CARF protein [Thalassotalea ponticola]MDN3651346.1 DUF1887 family CARF protein [Thalassotalea ponticola]